jgi:transcriptional regulator with XRE-family HTH domain
MASELPDELTLRRRIAANLQYYRRLSGMTQTELSERINYSDKSVSKWERASGTPDIFVLSALAELYGVTVDNLISDNAPTPVFDSALRERSRAVTCVQCCAAIWLLATIVFAVLKILAPELPNVWYAFIIAAPVSCAVTVTFSTIWWNHTARLLSISALAWATAACTFTVLRSFRYSYLLFIVCGASQVFVLIWYLRWRLLSKFRRK